MMVIVAVGLCHNLPEFNDWTSKQLFSCTSSYIHW